MNKPTDLVHFSALAGIDRKTINGALSPARNATMLALIGSPCGRYTSDCQEPTNPAIAALMETADLGPFRARGLRPAIRTLRAIMADIRAEHPALHALLGSAGMLCCRLVSGSKTAISNHSWGCAIDLKIDGQLDPRGDVKTQQGLLDIHPIFNRHGFFWGAAFTTEDAMHFEASDQLIRKWSRSGEFGAATRGVTSGLTIGDRSFLVERLQLALSSALSPMTIEADGIFGKDTRAAVVEFQRCTGLKPDGIASARVQSALGVT